MSNVLGLHHVTAIASDPQRNLDFYAGLLGLRLVDLDGKLLQVRPRDT
jgi:glyoxalase family protein